MGRLYKEKLRLIQEANRRLLGEQKRLKKVLGGGGTTNLEFIVNTIWEPNTPDGYNSGENAKALMDYFEKTFNGQYEGQTDYIWICSPNEKSCSNKFAIKADGEYIYIYKCIEQPRLLHNKNKTCPVIEKLGHWGGDSTWNLGGNKVDSTDITEIFEILGLSSHLSETR